MKSLSTCHEDRLCNPILNGQQSINNENLLSCLLLLVYLTQTKIMK